MVFWRHAGLTGSTGSRAQAPPPHRYRGEPIMKEIYEKVVQIRKTKFDYEKDILLWQKGFEQRKVSSIMRRKYDYGKRSSIVRKNYY